MLHHVVPHAIILCITYDFMFSHVATAVTNFTNWRHDSTRLATALAPWGPYLVHGKASTYHFRRLPHGARRVLMR
jgi:hypothetical protein